MAFEQKKNLTDIHETVRVFDELRRFEGNPPEFWAGYMDAARRLVEADFAVLFVHQEQGDGTGAWKPMGVWPAARRADVTREPFAGDCRAAAETAFSKGVASLEQTDCGTIIASRLESGDEQTKAVALFAAASITSALSLDERLTRLSLIADIPMVYRLKQDSKESKGDVVRFAETLDLLVLLNQEKRFIAAAMTFVNELAARFACSRVSLGWLEDGYVRVKAISHMEQFEKKMDAVQAMEKAMDEALDQNEEILFPLPDGAGSVVKAHGEFSEKLGAPHLVSLPIRPDTDPCAVLLCEREKEPFNENDVKGLRLFCDQSARRLSDLKTDDVWFGTKIKRNVREKLSGFFGVENTFYKALAVVAFFLLAFFLFGRIEYRVEAPFILKTDDVAYLPSPFEGYIKTVNIQPGDSVAQNQTLLTLDTQELLIEESAAIADSSRYGSESDKARASGSLAEMKIADALKAQAEAKLQLVRYHLANAEIKAPFAGVVVEGDLKEMLGAPVKKGDILFKVARIEHLYAELDVDERDVHEIKAGNAGQIAFVSKPEHNYTVRVDMVNPAAVSKEKNNVFQVRCVFKDNPQTWWRPGMSGISKISAGRRNVCWIVTHRTVEYLRLLFWW
jgi:multidrug resistance efflux pump